ncbi:hypothetical protein [Mesorhizobium erdmanii]|uniref:Novel STAND NTPase 3 domain-containing protein n=1 Tax=Mesorhizobium erdmanii TaxID=1777866 RepID=A0A6M7UP01_9HYPH|nr:MULTISPECIES: hypothetical protein [Mesorhizobium]OBQ58640.1 hypothetical protein A8146_22185 [Mesorhizobium loti]QKC77883.1 hypothetical protein EB233_22260 [Mesorhizobium erdmanii]
MSIARTAPESFEFQDLACVHTVLRFVDAGVGIDRFVVEPKGGEDGSLYTTSPDALHFEVQVKAGSTPATIESLALWMTHFPERTDRGMLIERLMADSQRRVIVIATGRASDALEPLIVGDDWPRGQSATTIKVNLAKQFIQAFRASAIDDNGQGKLHSDRVLHHAATAATFTVEHVRDVLSRIAILDRATKDTVTDRIERHLRKRGIPDDRLGDMIARLRAIVGTKRKNGEDLASAIEAQIAREIPSSIIPLDYVPGSEEADWTALFSTDNCLLLSGVTRCGKSTTAKWIAGQFERHGARIEQFGTIEEVERFLFDPAGGLRIAVLDDPLGGAHPAPEPERQLQRLSALVPRLRANRRLIVSQGRERLLEVAGVEVLQDSKPAGVAWVDMSERPSAFLATVWQSFCIRSGLADPLRSAVGQALRAGSVRLEPGTLEYLANLPSARSGTMCVEDAVRAATVDADVLAGALRLESRSPTMLKALALGSAPQEPVARQDLAFVAGKGGDLLPSKASYLGLTRTLGGGKRAQATLPNYTGEMSISDDDQEDLDMLERRRMVETDSSHRSGFTHAMYRSAAERIFRPLPRREIDDMMVMHERALFARSPATTRAAARGLDWLMVRLGSKDALLVLKRAEEGLQSLYLTTRDICFDFLNRHYSAATEAGIDVAEAADHVSAIQIESLDWHEGEPMLPPDGNVRDDEFLRFYVGPDEVDVAPALQILESPSGSALTPEVAGEAILFLKHNPESASRRHVESLLSYDAAVVRAEAVEIWLSRSREDDNEVLGRIFDETHPAVARAAVESTAKAFIHLSEPRQQQVVRGLKAMVTPANATVFLRFLVVFDRGRLTPESVPWELFQALMPTVLDALPAQAHFNEARLYDVGRKAGKILASEAIASLCDSWISWARRTDGEGGYLNDFSLGVIDLLFDYLSTRADLRADGVQRLLDLHLTGNLLTAVSNAVEWWPSLSALERDALLRTLTKDTSDRIWRQAVALTRREVPKEIEEVLLPSGSRYKDGHVEIRKQHPELFEACFAIATGYPGRFEAWQQNPNSKFWQDAIVAIARDPTDPLFDGAFELVLSRSTKLNPNVRKLILAAAAVDANAVFRHLLRLTIFDGARQRKNFWTLLFEAIGPDKNLDPWLDEMAEVAQHVLDKATSSNQWISDPVIRKSLDERMSRDILVYTMLQIQLEADRTEKALSELPYEEDDDQAKGGDDNAESLAEGYANLIIKVIKAKPPRFLATIDDTIAIFRHLNMGEELIRILRAEREILVPVFSESYRQATQSKASDRPAGWVVGVLN